MASSCGCKVCPATAAVLDVADFFLKFCSFVFACSTGETGDDSDAIKSPYLLAAHTLVEVCRLLSREVLAIANVKTRTPVYIGEFESFRRQLSNAYFRPAQFVRGTVLFKSKPPNSASQLPAPCCTYIHMI